MGDRRLLLEAYRRTGIDFLDDVDGDFAFVIWDDREQRVIAVRDRFGMKPLFFERTPTGIRFASEPKQLAATSVRRVEPCARSIVEYVTAQPRETRLTFFAGIERVRPSTALIVDRSGERVHRYWNPGPTTVPAPAPRDIADTFRNHVADSVRRRLDGSTGAVSHLSGGLDSSSIAAAAHVLADRGGLPAPFHTASAVFPGHTIDESAWITEVASRQPFPHSDFVPTEDTLASYEADMWMADQPRVNRIRDMWSSTADIANAAGADHVIAGIGGDQVLDHSQLILDRLRRGTPAERLADARAYAAWTGQSLTTIASVVARDIVPVSVKRSIRRLIPARVGPGASLLRRELWESLSDPEVDIAPFAFGYPSLTQDGVVGATQHPSVVWVNEVQEAAYASRGLSLTQPYFDRTLIEFVASIPPRDRPFDGRSKALVRVGFREWLPSSVINRRTQAFADDYLDVQFARLGADLRDRYPTVPEAALRYFDPQHYAGLLRDIEIDPPGFATRETLWAAWTVMLWLDGLDRYRDVPGERNIH